MASESWLKCTVHKGMFSDELVVEVRTQRNTSESFIVPRDKVEGEVGGEGKVHVWSFEDDGKPWAVFPDPHREVVPVRPGDLST